MTSFSTRSHCRIVTTLALAAFAISAVPGRSVSAQDRPVPAQDLTDSDAEPLEQPLEQPHEQPLDGRDGRELLLR